MNSAPVKLKPASHATIFANGVLTECDLAQLDPMSRRLLFVGLTRARVRLEWVMSRSTASLVEQTLGAY